MATAVTKAIGDYKIASGDLLLDATPRRYVLKINDLPPEDKPREKLVMQGPESLSSPELLAVLLTTGTRKEDVLTMARRVMKEYGDRSVMMARNPATLADELDIPLFKAAQIVAAAELGRRFFRKNSASAPTVRTARDVFEHVKDMRDHPKEYLRGLYLNMHYKVIHDEVISIGTVDSNLVHPREVFRPALEYAAAAVILVHNHPSCETRASTADITITKQLIEAGRLLGISLIDHVIVTKDDFASVPAEYNDFN
jgi:DNA repair protein RadC